MAFFKENYNQWKIEKGVKIEDFDSEIIASIIWIISAEKQFPSQKEIEELLATHEHPKTHIQKFISVLMNRKILVKKNDALSLASIEFCLQHCGLDSETITPTIFKLPDSINTSKIENESSDFDYMPNKKDSDSRPEMFFKNIYQFNTYTLTSEDKEICNYIAGRKKLKKRIPDLEELKNNFPHINNLKTKIDTLCFYNILISQKNFKEHFDINKAIPLPFHTIPRKKMKTKNDSSLNKTSNTSARKDREKDNFSFASNISLTLFNHILSPSIPQNPGENYSMNSLSSLPKLPSIIPTTEKTNIHDLEDWMLYLRETKTLGSSSCLAFFYLSNGEKLTTTVKDYKINLSVTEETKKQINTLTPRFFEAFLQFSNALENQEKPTVDFLTAMFKFKDNGQYREIYTAYQQLSTLSVFSERLKFITDFEKKVSSSSTVSFDSSTNEPPNASRSMAPTFNMTYNSGRRC